MKFSIPPAAQAFVKGFVFLLLFVVSGCSSSQKPGYLDQAVDQQNYQPRIKWYAHCDTCNWCRGAFKNTQEVQRVVSEHNIEKHDWVKVAYYNQTSCGK